MRTALTATLVAIAWIGSAPTPAHADSAVVEAEDLGAVWPCEVRSDCWDQYLDFLTLASDHATPISGGTLGRQLAEIELDQAPRHESPPSGDLSADLIAALNMGFLLDGLDERPLTVTVIERDEFPAYTRQRLLLHDPYVGTFDALLLTPPSEDPVPAVIALHGHGDCHETYIEQYRGWTYPHAGYAFLAIGLRAAEGGGPGTVEDMVATRALLDGYSLVGLHAYEAILGLRYLRHLPAVDGDRVGLIGHSGGSAIGNLAVRMHDGFAAYVSDMAATYYHPGNDETTPSLYPFHKLVEDFSTCPTPVLVVDYDAALFPMQGERMFDFFDAAMPPEGD